MNNNKIKAINFRKQGKSYNEISKILVVPKSTLSYWFKRIELTDKVLNKMKNKSRLAWSKNITQYNKNRAEKIKKYHLDNQSSAANEIKKISDYELKLTGVILYWAEGGKRGNRFEFTNSDPVIIRIIIKFLNQVCLVQNSRIKAQINIHQDDSPQKVLKYWQSITGLSRKNFYKIMYYNNIASKNKRQKNRLPFGTVQLRVYDKELFNKVIGWIKGVEKAIYV